MPYRVQAWIPCEEENITIYRSKADADSAVESMSAMQPENIYQTKECDELGEDI